MKYFSALFFGLAPLIVWAQVSIYDIQFTSQAGDGTYPSVYEGQTVTTGGIVTENNLLGGRFFISSSAGGPWSGLFIYDNTNSCAIGDSIVLTGQVAEYNGHTELINVVSFDVISAGNVLPDPVEISTAQYTEEPYEAVLVKMTNCLVTQTYDQYANFKINDGSGDCLIRSGLHNLEAAGFPLFVGYPFAAVTGLVWDYYGWCFLPQSINDYQSAANAFVITTPALEVVGSDVFSLPVNLSLLNQTATINSYSIALNYNADVFNYVGFNPDETLAASGTVNDNSVAGTVHITFSGSADFSHQEALINLQFNAINTGNGNLQFKSVNINGETITYTFADALTSVNVGCTVLKADTLTVIQRPLLNIPAIVKPGEQLTMECFAPPSTTNWQAQLLFHNQKVDLTITQTDYDENLDKWTLKALIPDVNVFELYDLKVSASDGLVDTAAHAVKIIDNYKTDYYFVQITDAHMPGHTFWGDNGYEDDETELADMEEVIADINLLNPEFVLFTGDLLNEGEMEDFECLRHHTKVIKLLQKFEVPVYIVPGNHDLGGWPDTPPEQGTARQEWWRFFGWRQRTVPPVEQEYYVHDYSFDYGNVHFTGLESSDNYDSYLYEIYGSMGFIPSQLTWLSNDLAAAGDKSKVLFYHYDFNNDLNLQNLGVDMALWGHIHANVDDFTHPYDIATDNVCDGTQAYRVIHVNNKELIPEYTLYVQDNGEQNLSITFDNENNGQYPHVAATITNKQDQDFNHALVKFVMPKSENGYNITNGTLQQIVPDGEVSICYVNVALKANANKQVSIETKAPEANRAMVANGGLSNGFPNPFTNKIQLNYALKSKTAVQLIVCNSAGKQIKVLTNETQPQGNYEIWWDGTNQNGEHMNNGVYFVKFLLAGKLVSSRQIILMR